MFKRVFVAALLFGMAATAPPVFAQHCGIRDAMVERLQKAYSETLSAGGLQGSASDNAMLVEVWSSEKTGTFTVMLTNPQGITCIMAAGTDWHQSRPIAEPPGTAG